MFFSTFWGMEGNLNILEMAGINQFNLYSVSSSRGLQFEAWLLLSYLFFLEYWGPLVLVPLLPGLAKKVKKEIQCWKRERNGGKIEKEKKDERQQNEMEKEEGGRKGWTERNRDKRDRRQKRERWRKFTERLAVIW